MFSSATKGRPRRAMASLELALVFPLLLLFVSALFMIARAGVAKMQTAMDARRLTWQKRPQAPAGSPLDVEHHPMDSRIDSAPKRDVPMGPGFGGKTQQAESRNTLIGNPWAFQAVPFPSLDQNVVPHTTVMSHVAWGLGTAAGDLCSFMAYLYPSGVFSLANVPSKIVNYALIGAGIFLSGSVFASWPGFELLEAALGKKG